MAQDFTLSLDDRINRSATSSRNTDGIKRTFKSVLRAIYNHPYINIPPKPSRAYMGFCDALTGIKKALASRQETPPKLALSPIECQNPPYYLADYRVNGSEKKSRGVCHFRKIQKNRATGVDFSQVRQKNFKKNSRYVCRPALDKFRLLTGREIT